MRGQAVLVFVTVTPCWGGTTGWGGATTPQCVGTAVGGGDTAELLGAGGCQL